MQLKSPEEISCDRYEIETASIFESVENDWARFDRKDLTKLCDALELLLQQAKISVIKIYLNETRSYFDKVLRVDIPHERSKRNNDKAFPIPAFFVAADNTADEIALLETNTEFIVSPENIHFNMFFAYRIATLLPNDVEPFLIYHLERTFDSDSRRFKQRLDFILADYSSVVGHRKNIITELTVEICSIEVETEKSTSAIIAPLSDMPFTTSNLSEIFLPDAIPQFQEIERTLILDRYFNENYTWVRDRIELVSFILILFSKKYFRPFKERKTDSKKLLTIRNFFQKRYGVDISKQMQPAEIKKYNLPKKHEMNFSFIGRAE
jgi:hypothetical protein